MCVRQTVSGSRIRSSSRCCWNVVPCFRLWLYCYSDFLLLLQIPLSLHLSSVSPGISCSKLWCTVLTNEEHRLYSSESWVSNVHHTFWRRLTVTYEACRHLGLCAWDTHYILWYKWFVASVYWWMNTHCVWRSECFSEGSYWVSVD